MSALNAVHATSAITALLVFHSLLDINLTTFRSRLSYFSARRVLLFSLSSRLFRRASRLLAIASSVDGLVPDTVLALNREGYCGRGDNVACSKDDGLEETERVDVDDNVRCFGTVRRDEEEA
jgi:hypothetical protein